MKLYLIKLCIKKGASYLLKGNVEYVRQDHWTTIRVANPTISDGGAKYEGKANLMKQIAKEELGNIRLWQRVELDNSDIEVVR